MKKINSWFACRQLPLLLISVAMSLTMSGCTKHATHNASPYEKSWDACPMPLYPAKAQALRKDGVVNAVLHVNPNGEVVSVEPAGDEIFFDSTVKALSRCQFPPGTSSKVLKTITFKLESTTRVEITDDVDALLGGLSPDKSHNEPNADNSKYASEIKTAIEGNFYDASSFRGKSCTLRIHLAPDGLLMNITAEGGDPDLCQAAIAGAKKTQFPVPPNREVYEKFKNALLDFRP